MSKSWSKYFAYILAVSLIVILLWVIGKQIKEYHLQDDPMLQTLKEALKPVQYNGKSITENLKLYKGDKSFTINKSQTFLCLYDENGDYYPLNMLVYVLLHEIAHSLNKKDVGHTEEFHKVFDDLLEQATRNGIYNPSIPVINGYCEF